MLVKVDTLASLRNFLVGRPIVGACTGVYLPLADPITRCCVVVEMAPVTQAGLQLAV